MLRARVYRSERVQNTPSRVKHGHAVNPSCTRRDVQAIHGERSVVRDAPVMEQRSLGEPGGPGGVLDLHRIVGRDRRQRPLALAGSDEVVPVGERDQLAQLREVPTDRLDRSGHRVAAILRREEQPGGAGLAEHVLELGRFEGRIDRHQHQACEGGAELELDPLGDVGRPHRDSLARLETRKQRPGRPLGVGEELGVGPTTVLRRARHRGHQRRLVGHLCSRAAQHVSDGEVEKRPARIGGPVGFGQRHGSDHTAGSLARL